MKDIFICKSFSAGTIVSTMKVPLNEKRSERAYPPRNFTQVLQQGELN